MIKTIYKESTLYYTIFLLFCKGVRKTIFYDKIKVSYLSNIHNMI